MVPWKVVSVHCCMLDGRPLAGCFRARMQFAVDPCRRFQRVHVPAVDESTAEPSIIPPHDHGGLARLVDFTAPGPTVLLGFKTRTARGDGRFVIEMDDDLSRPPLIAGDGVEGSGACDASQKRQGEEG